jgi:uncharacterized membrane protein (DUF4010 family)
MPISELPLTDIFLRLGLAALLGFAIGLERTMGLDDRGQPHTGLRDFVLFGLLGALTMFIALELQSILVFLAGILLFAILLFSGYWRDFLREPDGDPGITTEVAAVLTFFLGALAVEGEMVTAIAIGIVVLAVLSQGMALGAFTRNVKRFELDAALKLLVISFIILPILPNQSLDEYVSLPLGEVTQVQQEDRQVTLALVPGISHEIGDKFRIYDAEAGNIGQLEVKAISASEMVGRYLGENFDIIQTGTELRAEFGIQVVSVMLSALRPYKVWLIVILVSFISFVGYVLVKVFGSSAGIGLTGLVGGLASSTVTTLSFARRSLESPALNRHFAVAILLASTVMFPRLLMQIAVVNQALMMRMVVPIMVMAATGIGVAVWYFVRARKDSGEAETLSLSNPFSLKSALNFALVFASILMVTRLAITYLGEAWLPVVALVSGLTDADAIAFSVSDAQQDGLITLDWAAFNAVLGAIANTFMKLMLVYSLGDKGLFRKLLGPVVIIGCAGLGSAFIYYDISAVARVAEVFG